MSGPEVLAAHKDLTPILASLAITWREQAARNRDEASRLRVEADVWYGGLTPDERMAANATQEQQRRHMDNMQRAAVHSDHAENLRAIAKEADGGLLAITQAEHDDPSTVPFLPAAVVAMAKATGRLKLIG